MIGPLFLLCLGLATVVMIGLTLLTPFDLGPSFLIGIVASLLTFALLSTGALSQVSAFDQAGIQALQNFVTGLPNAKPIFDQSGLYQTLEALSVVTSSIATILGVDLITGSSGWTFVGGVVLFACSLLSLVLDTWHAFGGSPILVVFAAALSAIGATVGARLASQEPNPSWSGYFAFTSLSGGFSFAFDTAEIV